MRFFPKGDLPITLALACFLGANLLDAIITLALLQLHIGKELNPFMLWAYRQSPIMFMMTKVLVASLVIFVNAVSNYSSDRKQRLVRFGAAVFSLVVISHFVQLIALACS